MAANTSAPAIQPRTSGPAKALPMP
jgi:hypothetical protein